MPVKPIPDGYHTVTPQLNVKDAAKLIEFMKQAFGAEERMRMPGPDGALMHAEVKIGDSLVMLSDAVREAPMPAWLFLYVEDVDAAYQRALRAGATSALEPTDMFWGDRFASVGDAFGNRWGIATHKEDVPPQDMGRRAQEFFKKQGG